MSSVVIQTDYLNTTEAPLLSGSCWNWSIELNRILHSVNLAWFVVIVIMKDKWVTVLIRRHMFIYLTFLFGHTWPVSFCICQFVFCILFIIITSYFVSKHHTQSTIYQYSSHNINITLNVIPNGLSQSFL